MKPTIYRAALAVLCFLFLGTTALWLRLDHSPPAWDDAFYLSHSLQLYDALTTGGLPAFGKQFLTGMRDKPPLIASLPAPAYLLFGRNPRVALGVNLVCLMLMFAAIFRAGRKYAGPRAGLLAIFILGTMPMIYGLSHRYLVECGLTAIACLAICLAADSSPGLRTSLILGVLCSLGMLMKFSFPLYVMLPLAFLLWPQRRQVFRLKMVSVFLLPAVAIAAPWYIVNFAQGLRTMLQAGSGETAQVYGTGAILSVGEIGRYLVNILNCGPAIYFVSLAVLLPLCFRALQAPAKRGLFLCCLWATPLLFLTFGHYRDLRYAAPLFPSVALALGILLDTAIERDGLAAVVATCVALGLGAASMLQTSFGLLGNLQLELGGLLFSPPRFSYAGRAEPVVWPHRAVLQELYNTAEWTGGEHKRLVIGNDAQHFNADNLALAALASRLPFDVSTTAYETDKTRLQRTLAIASYFLYKEGGEPDSPFNRLGSQAYALVRADPRFAEVGSGPLPDGGRLHIFQGTPPNRFRQVGAYLMPGMDRLADCSVIFDGKLELSGVSVQRTAEGLEVQYRWRCLKTVQRNYWCFTHILDEGGNVVGYLDHPVMKDDPPTSQWTGGSLAIERLQFALPATQKPQSYRLRLGLFDKETGNRLPITGSSLPVTDSNTAAVTGPSR